MSQPSCEMGHLKDLFGAFKQPRVLFPRLHTDSCATFEGTGGPLEADFNEVYVNTQRAIFLEESHVNGIPDNFEGLGDAFEADSN